MSTPAPHAAVAALNEKIEASKTPRICTICGESVGIFWAGRVCRSCFIESNGFTSETQYNAAHRGER